MMYAPHVAEHYGLYIPETAMWNWRWMNIGHVKNEGFDKAMFGNFNEHMRHAMETLTPSEALAWLAEIVPEHVTEHVTARMTEAQARLFPPLIAGREGNLVKVNFRRVR